jgi:hypothetical protein
MGMMESARWRCGEAIGVYEPVVVVGPVGVEVTSRYARPQLGVAQHDVYHADCYARDRNGARAEP